MNNQSSLSCLTRGIDNPALLVPAGRAIAAPHADNRRQARASDPFELPGNQDVQKRDETGCYLAGLVPANEHLADEPAASEGFGSVPGALAIAARLHKKPKTRPGTSEIAEAAFLLEYKALKGLPLGRANGRSRAIMVSVRREEGLEAPASASEDPELEADTSLLTRAPAEWSRASDAVKAHFAFEAMNRAGPVLDFTAWLSDEVNALAYTKGKPLLWLRERITLRLRQAFKRRVAFVLVIEEEFNIVTRTFRLHVHGLLQLDPRLKTRKLARKALRSALGTWEGKGKNRQIWLRRDPDCGWPAYFTKRCFLATARMRARMRGFGADHRWVTTFDGPVLTMTNEVRAAARELHAEARQLVINVRRGISQPALKKGVAAPFRPLTATTNPSRAKHVRPSISTSAKIRAAWKLGLRSPRALAALAGRAPAITSVLPSKVLHPWHSRGPPNSLDVPRSYRNPIPAKDPTMPETTPTKRKYTRLSPSKWAEIEALWQVGDLTLSELADAHGVSPRAIQDHMSKRGIIKGSKGAEFAEAVREEIVALELGDKDLTANRAREVRETAYEHARQIEQLVMAQIALAQREPGQILRVASALKGLSLAAGTLERLHGLKYRAMGLEVDHRLLH